MDTRRALLDRARHAFAERGYAATSLEDLARGLGLTKAAVYHHFTSKRELLEALLEESFQKAERALEQGETLEERLLSYALAYRDQIEPLTALMTAQSGRRGGDQQAARVALEAMSRGLARLQQSLEQAVPGQGQPLAAIFASIVHGAYMMARHLPGYELEGMLRIGVQLFVRGLPVPPAQRQGPPGGTGFTPRGPTA